MYRCTAWLIVLGACAQPAELPPEYPPLELGETTPENTEAPAPEPAPAEAQAVPDAQVEPEPPSAPDAGTAGVGADAGQPPGPTDAG